MPVLLSPSGKEVEVIKIVADDSVRKHLQSLGILIGAMIKPVMRGSGNLILDVLGSRVAVNKDLAMKIFVR